MSLRTTFRMRRAARRVIWFSHLPEKIGSALGRGRYLRFLGVHIYLLLEVLSLLLAVFALGNSFVLTMWGYESIWVFFSPLQDIALWALAVLGASLGAMLIHAPMTRGAPTRVLAVAAYLLIDYGSPSWATAYIFETWGRLFAASIVLVATVAILVATTDSSERLLGLSRAAALQIVTVYFVSFFMPFEFWTSTHMLLLPLHVYWPRAADGAAVEFVIQSIGLLAVPWLYLLFFSSWFRFFVPSVLSRKGYGTAFLAFKSASKRLWAGEIPSIKDALKQQSNPTRQGTTDLVTVLALVASLLAGAFAAYYPSFLTGGERLLGQDINEPGTGYLDVMRTIEEKGFGALLTLQRIRSGPLFYFFLYAIMRLFGLTASALLAAMPVLNTLFLTASTFWFMRVGFSNRVAALSAFFASLSYPTIFGTYTGILSNWFALSLFLIALSFYARSIRLKTKRDVLLASVVAFSVLFVHSWTFALLLGVVFFYLLLSLSEGRKLSDFDVKSSSAIIVTSVLVLLITMSVFIQPAGNLISTLQTFIVVSVRPGTLSDFWRALDFLVKLRLFSFFPILLFATFGALLISAREPFQRVLGAWVMASSFASVLISPFGLLAPNLQVTESYLWRSLFNVPFGTFAGLGLYCVLIGLEPHSEARSNPRTLHGSAVLLQALLIGGYLCVTAIILFGEFPMLIPLIVVNYFIATVVLMLSGKCGYHRLGQSSLLVLVLLSLLNYTLRSMLIAV
jgi:hypothetical protein